MHYMDVQYGIENPVSWTSRRIGSIYAKAILPWMLKYAFIAPKISRLQVPVVDFLKRYTRNQGLIDIITQHFFQQTPAYFALSYISLYLDYHYPVGGTGKIVAKMVDFNQWRPRGTIRTNTEIICVDPTKEMVTDSHGEYHAYRRLIWAADQKALYGVIDPEELEDPRLKISFMDRRGLIADKVGNNSVYTLFLALNMDPAHFARIASEHFFYTPSRVGQSVAGPIPVGKDRAQSRNGWSRFFALTTYEISCPVLRDAPWLPQERQD